MATALSSRPLGQTAKTCSQSLLHSDSTSANENSTAGWIRALANQQNVVRAGMDRPPDLGPRSARDEVRLLASQAHKARTTLVTCPELDPTENGFDSIKTTRCNGKPLHARPTTYLTSCVGLEVAKHAPQERTGTGANSPYKEVANSAMRPTEHLHTSASTDKNGRGQKRPQDQSLDDEDDGGQDSRPMSSFKRRREGQESRLSFACPFFKKDPAKWRACHKHELRKISYVKQHLYRTHNAQPYCPICGEIFKAYQREERLNQHLRLRECEPKTFEPPQGITWQQREQLSRRVPARLSEEEQWFMVFDIVFPGHPRPSTPYIHPDMSEDLSSYLEFAATQGSRVLKRSFLRNAKSFSDGRFDEAALESLFRQGLDDLRRQWVSKQSSTPSPRDPSPRPQTRETEHTTPVLTSTIEGNIRPWASLDCLLSDVGGLDQASIHTDSTGHSPNLREKNLRSQEERF